MKKRIFLLSAIFMLFGMTCTLRSQNRFSVTLFGGGSTGAYELSRAGLGTAKAAYRINIGYTVLPILDAYVGYNRNGFTCKDGGFCNEAPVEFVGSGFNAGLRLNRGPDGALWIPWFRAGLSLQTLEILQTGGNEPFNYKSDAALGFELGTGFTIPVTKSIKIVPSFNYMRYTVTGANNAKSKVVILSGLAGIKYSF